MLGGDIPQVASMCERVSKDYQLQCANNVGRVISTAVANDLSKIERYCGLLPSHLGEECTNAVGQSVFVLGDEVLPFKICKMISSAQGKMSCYGQLAESFKTNRIPAIKMKELCGKFEEKYRYLCDAA